MKKTIGVILVIIGIIVMAFMVFNTHKVGGEPMTSFLPVIDFKLHLLFCWIFFLSAEFCGAVFYFDWF